MRGTIYDVHTGVTITTLYNKNRQELELQCMEACIENSTRFNCDCAYMISEGPKRLNWFQKMIRLLKRK